MKKSKYLKNNLALQTQAPITRFKFVKSICSVIKKNGVKAKQNQTKPDPKHISFISITKTYFLATKHLFEYQAECFGDKWPC